MTFITRACFLAGLLACGCQAHVRVEAVDALGRMLPNARLEVAGTERPSPAEIEVPPGPLDIAVSSNGQRTEWHGRVARGRRILRIGPLPEGPQGTRSMASINEQISKAWRETEYCYADELQSNRRLAGQIVIRFLIGADGRTFGVFVEDATVLDATFESCVARVFENLVFEPDTGLTVIRLPVVLRSYEREERRVGPD